MLRTLKRWLAPPLQADDELNRRAALLNTILWAMLAAAVVASPLLLLGPAEAVPAREVALASIVVLVLALRAVLQRGRLALAGACLVGGLWLIVTLAILQGGDGVRSLGYPSYMLLLLVAGLVLGKRAGLALAGLSSLVGLSLLYAQSAGMLRATIRPDTNLEIWLVESIYFVAAAVLLYLALANLDQALGRARQELAERRRAEAQLRQLSRAVEQNSASIIIADANGIVQYVNPKFTQVSGYSQAEALGQKAEKLKSSEMTRAEVQQMWDTLAADGEWRGEFHNRRKNGEPYWESVLISRVHEAAGDSVNYVAVLEDITARKQMAQALAEAQNFLRLVVDSSPSMIFVINAAGRVVFANRYTADYYGTTPEALMARATGEVHPDGDQAQGFENDDLAVIRTGQRLAKEELNTAPNGEPHWFYTVKVPLRRPDGTVDVVGISTDITDSKQRERELQAIAALSAALRAADSIPQMLAVVLEQIRSLLNVAAMTVELVEPETGDARVELALGPWQAMVGQRIARGSGLNSYIQASGQPYVNNDVASDPRTLNPALYQGYHAAAGVPLSAQGQIIGFLWVGYQSDIREADVRLLMSMADIAANAIRRVRLHAQTEERARRLAALHEIDLAITSSLDVTATLNLLAGHALSQLAAEAVVIWRRDPAGHGLTLAAARGSDGRSLPRALLRLAEAPAALAAQTQQLVGRPDLNAAPEPFAPALRAAGWAAVWAAPLLAKGKAVGVLALLQRAPLQPDAEWLNFLKTLASQAAVAIENAALIDTLQRSNQELSLAYEATIEGWSRALDLRDKQTEGHTQRVAERTLRLARAVSQVDPAAMIHIRRGALLHDMGKLGIPDQILLKPAELTVDEWAIMRRHPEYAYRMLAPIEYLRPALDIPYCHHEKWDGSGYPRGLKGEAIPLAARLFAVVDVWDALCSNRPYRPAWPEEQVRAFLREQAGRHFDPAVVEVFLSLDLPE